MLLSFRRWFQDFPWSHHTLCFPFIGSVHVLIQQGRMHRFQWLDLEFWQKPVFGISLCINWLLIYECNLICRSNCNEVSPQSHLQTMDLHSSLCFKQQQQKMLSLLCMYSDTRQHSRSCSYKGCSKSYTDLLPCYFLTVNCSILKIDMDIYLTFTHMWHQMEMICWHIKENLYLQKQFKSVKWWAI